MAPAHRLSRYLRGQLLRLSNAKGTDIRKLSVKIGMIEAIANDKLIRTLEADEIRINLLDPPSLLI